MFYFSQITPKYCLFAFLDFLYFTNALQLSFHEILFLMVTSSLYKLTLSKMLYLFSFRKITLNLYSTMIGYGMYERIGEYIIQLTYLYRVSYNL